VSSGVWMCIGQDCVREFRSLLRGSSWTRLRSRTASTYDKRFGGRRDGNNGDDHSLGDCTSDQSRRSTRTSSRWGRLRCWQTETAELGWLFKVRLLRVLRNSLKNMWFPIIFNPKLLCTHIAMISACWSSSAGGFTKSQLGLFIKSGGSTSHASLIDACSPNTTKPCRFLQIIGSMGRHDNPDWPQQYIIA